MQPDTVVAWHRRGFRLFIYGELLKLGIAVSQSTVAKYIASRRRPPSQTWRTFLATTSAK